MVKAVVPDSRSHSCGYRCPCGAYEAAQKLLRPIGPPVVRRHLGVRVWRRLRPIWPFLALAFIGAGGGYLVLLIWVSQL